ncbi:hypothetical protein EV356DRAFT_514733 [Viridothelium virens]|uniref:Uncharacterized protein n=1 Tax=Viridothelium virens TaxID=1048519 RepID=A0A6A6HA11_VIRVR|nr:hypothetical protein EV356DRAFT_514733 [Viridothelium virens]
MATNSTPISAARFALAIHDLPLSSLHAKAAEIRNSLTHLRSSNEQLQPFANDGDTDCADAIRENEVVMRRMEERIELLRAEVEGRGMRWAEGEVEDRAEAEKMRDAEGRLVNGTESHGGADAMEGVEGNAVNGEVREATQGQEQTRQGEGGGRLTDEELQRRLREHLGDPDEDEGVHL